MSKKLYSPEETSAKFAALPQAVKDLLYGFEMTSIITKVGEKNGLHIDQMDTLNTETGQVMMGLQEVSEFPEILMEDLGVDQAKAAAIAHDIDEMLFSRVRAAMNKPSAVAATAPTNAPISAPAAVAAAPSMPSMSVSVPANSVLPTVAPEIHPADVLLTQKAVATAPVPAPTPAPAVSAKPIAPKTDTKIPQEYKADPYREPVN